jgi:ribosomal protein S18 acetylase RimI-like enzyme
MGVIGPLGPEHLDRATTTLARAFMADPMFEWIFPDPEKRARSLQRLNRVPLAFGQRSGRATQAHDGKAVAVWVPAGQPVSIGGMVRAGILGVPFQIGFRPFGMFMGANETMERIHKRYMPEPHWYLLIVGVDPELQGRGIGSALLQEGLAQVDQAGALCYTETSVQRNVAFYERHGFRVVETATLGKGGPPAWGMRREPQGAG